MPIRLIDKRTGELLKDEEGKVVFEDPTGKKIDAMMEAATRIAYKRLRDKYRLRNTSSPSKMAYYLHSIPYAKEVLWTVKIGDSEIDVTPAYPGRDIHAFEPEKTRPKRALYTKDFFYRQR